MLFDRQEAHCAVWRFWIGALNNAVAAGDFIKGSLMAGQSVGLVGAHPAVERDYRWNCSDAENKLQLLKQIFSGEGKS